MARYRTLSALLVAVALGGCESASPPAAPPPAPEPANVAASPPPPAATASPPAAPAGPLAAWITGTWSYDEGCGSDYGVTFNANGQVDNFGDIGTWTVEGDTIVQTIRENQEPGADPVPLAQPQVTRFRVEQIDANRGAILYEGRRIPIRRC